MAKATGSKGRRSWRHFRSKGAEVHLGGTPGSKPLLHAVDRGEPVVVPPEPFSVAGREPGWGPHLDGFLNANRQALQALDLQPRMVAGREGVRLELSPGGRAGAIPLRSPVTGQIAGGAVVSPRFGWSGIGRVLSATGWGSGPEFLPQPLVPGSGREVPPWVLAGPVLQRLADLLAHLRPGYRDRCEVRRQPRGRIHWPTYISTQLPSGRWHHLPCQFSELETDSRLRQAIRWTLERLQGDLIGSGGADPIAALLARSAMHLIEQVSDVQARRPSQRELDFNLSLGPMKSAALWEGLRAIGWIVDERGLGGGRNSDGLSWALPLETLWERYVERIIRDEAQLTGGRVRAGRLGETTVPLPWNDPGHRSLGHLVPDLVVYRPNHIEIVDAKYKAHFAELDATRWTQFTEDARDALRADVHQVLAYAAVIRSEAAVTATLVYPVQHALFEELQLRERDRVFAEIPVGTATLKLMMRAIPFGMMNRSQLRRPPL